MTEPSQRRSKVAVRFSMFARSKRWSALALIAANLVPLIGVFVLGWSVTSILVVYWVESVIIGVLNIPRIFATNGSVSGKLFISAFFSVHFGLFCFGHAVFLISLFEARPVFEQLRSGGALLYTALGFFISHAISLAVRFSRREFADKTPNDQLVAPYGRVMIMHATVLIGGYLMQRFGAPMMALIFLIALKTAVDYAAHRRETQKAEALTIPPE